MADTPRFLTPEAMLTPGAAGGVVTLIANTLFSHFGFPPAHVGLALSFLLGLLALVAARPWWERLIYYFFNSLIIFCVAFGAGQLAPAPRTEPASKSPVSLLISPSYAQSSNQLNGPSAILLAQTDPWQNPFGGPNSFFRCPFGGCLSQRVIDTCQEKYAPQTPAGIFVKRVAASLGVSLPEDPAQIIDAIQGDGWQQLANGMEAAERARKGEFVVAGLKGPLQASPSPSSLSLVAIVVNGPIAHSRYPTAYWTNAIGQPGRFETINWAWSSADRDKVVYAAKTLTSPGP